MTERQRIISIVVFIALLAAVMPSAASANSLLSGYGGPGEGSQAILGSALVNAPKGGGGAGGGDAGGGDAGSSGGAGAQPTEAESAQGSGASRSPGRASGATSASGAHGSTGHRRPAERSGSTGRAKHVSASRSLRSRSVIYPAASHEQATGGSRTLGLSGIDLAYIIIALGVLLATAFLTLRLARTGAVREPDGHL